MAMLLTGMRDLARIHFSLKSDVRLAGYIIRGQSVAVSSLGFKLLGG